jgi:hypothetical protein
LSTETSLRASADTSLSTAVSTALSTETSLRASADVVLSTALSTETSLRSSADTSLAQQIVDTADTKYDKRTGITIETTGIKLNSGDNGESGGYIYFGSNNSWRLYGTNGSNGATPEIRFEYSENGTNWTKAVWLN